MGVFSHMAAGAVDGLGRGVTAYGADLMRNAAADERDAQLRGGAGGAGGAAKKSPAQNLSDLGDLMLSGKGALSMMAGGMAPSRANDAAGMMRGEQPMTDVSLDSPDRRPDRIDNLAASGQAAAQAPKYSDGQAAALFTEAFTSLRRAMGIANPDAADNIANAEQTEIVTAALKAYQGGDVQAGRAVLASKGKTTYGTSGDEMTGQAPAGSVAASQIEENLGQAAEARGRGALSQAQARGEVAGGGGRGGSDKTVATLDAERKNIDQDIESSTKLIKQAQDALKDMPDKATEAELRRGIAAQQDRIRASQARRDDLSARIAQLTGSGGQPSAAPAAPAASPSAAPASQPNRVAPAQQSERDAQAGMQMIRSEFGGSLQRAKSELEQMRVGIRSAPGGEAKTMLQSQAARLEAGIRAMEAGGAKQSGSAAQGGVARPSSREEYERLPSGTLYIGQDGKTYRKK